MMLQYWGGPFDGLLTIADASQVGAVVDVVFGAGIPGTYVVESLGGKVRAVWHQRPAKKFTIDAWVDP